MTRDYFFYAVQSELRFTEDEVDILMRLSAGHYDGKCKSLSGVGGFIYGMKNQFLPVDGERPAEATRSFSWQDIDITCKVLEGAREPAEVTLFLQMRRLFAELRAESETLNARRP